MFIVAIEAKRCKGCGLCVDACPRGVLSLATGEFNGKGYTPARAGDMSLCIGCGACYRMCPDCAVSVARADETA